jgi:peptidoglycan/LPS O-acetylase OafA/YrhL
MRAILFHPVTAAKYNFHSIDVLRGLSAVAILVFHYFHFINGGGPLNLDKTVLQEVETLNYLSILRDNGASAIMLFWTISGFVFINVYSKKNINFKIFWVNRFARLYPLHFITLILVLFIQLFSYNLLGHFVVYDNNTLNQFILQLFFASEWFTPNAHSFNGPIWSVSIEIVIYVVFFLYIRFLPTNLASQILSIAAFGIAMILVPGSSIPVCGAYFFGGMLCYSVFFFCPSSYRIGLTLVALAVFGLTTTIYVRWGRHFPLPETVWLLAIYTPLLLALALSEVCGLQRYFKRAHIVGDITYSTYLWHTPLQMLFLLGAGVGFWPMALVRYDTFAIGYVVVSCLVGWVSFRFIERPAQGWIRERMLHRKLRAPLISAP